MPDTVTIRVEQDVYERLLAITHDMEREEGRRITMNETVKEILKRKKKVKK